MLMIATQKFLLGDHSGGMYIWYNTVYGTGTGVAIYIYYHQNNC